MLNVLERNVEKQIGIVSTCAGIKVGATVKKDVRVVGVEKEEKRV